MEPARHLGARFRAQVGLPGTGTGGSIADVAAAGRYADHSHLVREFRRLAGCTPSERAAENPGLR